MTMCYLEKVTILLLEILKEKKSFILEMSLQL
ncbi:hypothetical protein ES703_71708 [subsurface metagenome]